MILDRENHVAAGVAVAGTGNLLATDVIDLGPARDVGAGTPLWFYHTLNTAAPAGGTDITFEIVTSDDPTFASGVEVVSSQNVLLADMPVNFLTFQPVGRVLGAGRKAKRYLTARLVRGGTFTGATTWSSGITLSPDDYRQFYTATYNV